MEWIRKINKGILHIVYGTSADKDLEGIFELFPQDASYFFTEFTNERSAKIENLELMSNKFSLNAQFFDNAKDGLMATQAIANKEDTVLVFGSFFLISDLFRMKD